MGSALVVVDEPRVSELLRLVRGVKEVGVQDFLAIRAVEAFHEGVLHRLARLDVLQPDAALGAPFGERLRGQFRSVVEPEPIGASLERHELAQHADHARGRQRRAHFNGQALPIPFV